MIGNVTQKTSARWRYAWFLCLAITITLAAVPELLADPPSSEEVAITVLLDRTTDPFTRTWESSGAISDSGVWQTIDAHFGALSSPVRAILHFDTLFTNDAETGTFTIRRKLQVQLPQSEDDPDIVSIHDGQWHVIDASGIYAGLKGYGTLEGFDDGDFVISVTVGKVWFE